MICEKCGCHDRVTKTIQNDGQVIRIRRCIKCGYMGMTEERRLSPDEAKKKRRRPGRPPLNENSAMAENPVQ